MSAKTPMLAERESVHSWVDRLRFPLYAAPKLDGIRCIVADGKAVSRSFKPIPNRFVRGLLSRPEFAGLDGELTVGPLAAENVFNVTTSGVMSEGGEPDFEYHVFDDFTDPKLPYSERQVRLCERLLGFCESGDEDLQRSASRIRYVNSERLETWEGLEMYEDSMLGQGFEGVITRTPMGLYKFGRSTKTEQGMLKLKRFTDGEAEVIGFEELMRNTNPDLKDNFGHAKRSKIKDGLVPGRTLGKLQCRDLASGVEFQIGMFKGLTNGDKQSIWNNRETYVGRLVKYQHFGHGVVDKPRHSKFLGWRHPHDL